MTIQPSQFEVHPSSGIPIYRQIIDQVQAMLVGHQLQAGEMLPSVRQMAVELGLNPMTISKAYARMEADGILDRVRGKGMVIRDQPVFGNTQLRMQELDQSVRAAVIRGRQLGLNDKQILSVVNRILKDNPQ